MPIEDRRACHSPRFAQLGVGSFVAVSRIFCNFIDSSCRVSREDPNRNPAHNRNRIPLFQSVSTGFCSAQSTRYVDYDYEHDYDYERQSNLFSERRDTDVILNLQNVSYATHVTVSGGLAGRAGF